MYLLFFWDMLAPFFEKKVPKKLRLTKNLLKLSPRSLKELNSPASGIGYLIEGGIKQQFLPGPGLAGSDVNASPISGRRFLECRDKEHSIFGLFAAAGDCDYN